MKSTNQKSIPDKCKDMITGCRTPEQLYNALNYCLLAKKRGKLSKEDQSDIHYLGYMKKVELHKAL